MILVRRQRHREIDGLEIEPGRQRLLAPRIGRRAGRARGHEGDEVADMDHADGIVERLVVDDEPRMAGIGEHLQQLAERDVALHGDDVGTRHHDIRDPPLAQRQDVAAASCFLRARSRARRRPLEHVLEVGADRCWPSSRRSPAARARASLSPSPRATSLGRSTGTGRLRVSVAEAAGSLGPDGSESGMAISFGPRRRATDRGRERRAAPGSRLRAVPSRRPPRWPRDRSRRDGEIHAPPGARGGA